MEGFKFSDMSAAEIIEQIKMLPPQERSVVLNFAREQAVKETAAEETVAISREELDAVKAEIFANHDNLLRRLAQ